MNREDLLAMMLGEKKVFSVPAKLVFGLAGTYHQDPPKGLHQIMFGGIGFTTDKILAPNGGWQMLECELIIIPKRIRRKNKEEGFEHLRVDQAMVSNFAHADAWRECEEF